MRDVQKTVKSEIVTRSLQHSAGTAFARGRYIGKLESDAAWKAKEVIRKSKEATNQFVDAFRKQQEIDWSGLGEEELEKRLEFHGLVRKIDDDGSEGPSKKELAKALSSIAVRYGSTQNSVDEDSSTDAKNE